MNEIINCFNEIVPLPEKIKNAEGTFSLQEPLQIVNGGSFPLESDRLRKAFDFFQIFEAEESSAKVVFAEDPAPASPEAFTIKVTPDTITLSAAPGAGMLYATGALIQMLAIATTAGRGVFSDMVCGECSAVPRYGWRSFMLDCARHFRSKECIIKILHIMAHFRYNVFHWHLTDNEGWRSESKLFPVLNEHGQNDDGFYSASDIAEVMQAAEKLHISVVPEVDLPGHSKLLTRVLPQLGCRNDMEGCEVCIGSPHARSVIKELLNEFMKLFPGVKYIHLGGDEASTARWQQCPDCQAALKAKNLTDFSRLQYDFIMELIEQVKSAGKTPIVWNDAGVYPKDVVIELWSGDWLAAYKNGNKVICSSCTRTYTNRRPYWEIQYSPHLFEAQLCDTYYFEPAMGFEDYRDQIMGVEVCSWGEYLPERRVIGQIMPYLTAVSEAACCEGRQRFWRRFRISDQRQRSAGCENIW